MNHRGRFQAQGKFLEDSNNWAQDLPLTITEGIALLDSLQSRLNKKDAQVRSDGFAKCRNFIDLAYKNGGINISDMGKPLIKSFPKNFTERLDLEIHLGIAFVKENKQ